MKFLELKQIIEESIHECYQKDADLFDYKLFDHLVSERCLTYRLGYYLQNHLPNYKVDSEYNRYLEEIKTLDQKQIYPDLIIHQRKSNKDNLLWIEIKKQETEIKEDINRLKKVTNDHFYQYQYGLMLILKKDKYICIYFQKGKEIEHYVQDKPKVGITCDHFSNKISKNI